MGKKQIRVLLVEDSPDHAELIDRSFEPHAAHMALVSVRTLEEARAALRDSTPDLALIDLKLPDGLGTELLPKADEEAAYPIVIMTAQGDQQVAVDAMRAGAQNYVVKSAATFTELPRIAEATLREWRHIVERRRAESALQTSEEHFRSLIENAHDIITIVGLDGTISYTSPSIERVLGYTSSERFRANYFELVHPEDRTTVIRGVLQTTAVPEATLLLEYRYRHRDGSIRILESVCSSHQKGEEAQAVFNSRDVTDRKQLEDQLRHSQKWEIIGTLVSGIANEFNNMLTPILGFSSLALKEASPEDKSYQRLEHIVTAANRSRELAEQLLRFSRQSEPRRISLAFHTVLEETLKLLKPTLPPTIEIRRRISGERDTVTADPDQLRQVLMNLFTNAYHAMSDGGVLEVSLETLEGDSVTTAPRSHDGPWVRLTVRDTGHGMDSETRERVLEPFFTTKTAEERSGLGLAISHGIVVGHGGELMVDSEPGEGTTVQVYLPLADDDLGENASGT